MVTGTLVPHHALGLGPRAVLHGELLHPAGTCLLQAPAQRNPPPPLVPGPPLRGQALPAPCTLSSSQGQLPEPCLHAVGLSEDQGPPLPGPTPPEPAQAPATASTQTATPDAATLAEVPEEPLELLELGPDAFAEAFPQLAGDSQQLQHLQDQLPADLDSSGLEELLSCLDAVEPHDAFAAVPSSPVLKHFLSQLPDLCEDIEEPSTQGLAATRVLGEVPSSPGLHPDKVQAGRALQPPAAAVPPLSSPLKPAARPQLRRALPKRPPLQEFIPARRRTLPQPPLAPLKRRPDPDCLPAHKRPLPQPPLAPLKRPQLLPALRRALPSPPRSPLQSPPLWRGLPTALPTQPRTLQRPAQPRGDYVPCVGPWAGGDAAPTPLEEQESSVPITPQQRPERERLKKLAQEERQRATHHMRIGPGQFFEQRQKDHARAYSYGYP
nr:proline-rich protein 36-like [Anas platyrhynchos]